MADKFLKLVNGVPTETEAKTTSAGAADAGKIPALDSAGRLDDSMMPVGIGADVKEIVASENLSAGDFINVYDNTGTPTVRKADASTTGKHAHGFVIEAVTSGNSATVYFENANTQVSGATAGDVYLSDTTPGGFTSTPPAGAGKIVQKLGVAVGATEINVEIGQHYVLA